MKELQSLELRIVTSQKQKIDPTNLAKEQTYHILIPAKAIVTLKMQNVIKSRDYQLYEHQHLRNFEHFQTNNLILVIDTESLDSQLKNSLPIDDYRTFVHSIICSDTNGHCDEFICIDTNSQTPMDEQGANMFVGKNQHDIYKLVINPSNTILGQELSHI